MVSKTTSGAGPSVSRRNVLKGAAGMAGAAALAGTLGSRPAWADAPPIKFWDMIYGPNTYPTTGKSIVASYKPAAGLSPVTYQTLPWDGWLQTYSAAIASHTEPSISTGGTYQVIPFYDQGAILPADNVIAALKKNGIADDYQPGVLEMFTYKGHVVSIPWMVDIRLIYYRKSILEKAGVEPPANWDDLPKVGRALKKIGVIGFGIAGVNSFAPQALESMLVNNGGGFFNKAGEPDCLNDRNVEAVEFMLQLSREGIMDPAAVSQTGDNLNSGISSGKIGLAYNLPLIESSLTPEAAADIVLASPLAGPHGDKGTVSYFNDIMMYARTPSPESTEAFFAWYLDAIKTFWQKKAIAGIPLRKSFAAMPEFASNPNAVRAFNEWVPVSKWMGAQADKPFPQMNSVDGGQALNNWAQQIIIGQQSAKQILQDMQDGIEDLF